MSWSRLAILSVGARSPLGLNGLQTAMCARARKIEPRASEFFDRRNGRVGLCRAIGVSPGVYGMRRLISLAAPALAEACADVSWTSPPPLVLAIPDRGRPGDEARYETDLIPAIAARVGIAIDARRSRVVRAGHAGGAVALEAAEALVAAAPDAPVIVGGVDSYWHPAVVDWLDEERRLHGPDAEEGFIPGEGAAFAVVTGRARSALATVSDLRTGNEDQEDAVIAAAMTRIVRSIVEAPGRSPAGWVLSDVNGERHRITAWERVAARGLLADPVVHQRIPDDMGDLGAATGIMMVALASVTWRAGCAPRPSALAVLHADGGERASFLLEAAE